MFKTFVSLLSGHASYLTFDGQCYNPVTSSYMLALKSLNLSSQIRGKCNCQRHKIQPVSQISFYLKAHNPLP